MKIIHKNDLHYGGFAGLKEHRIVMDKSVFLKNKSSLASDGIGSFIYLADAKFNPYGQTNMHWHHDVDVITVMIDGQISHEGSLEHGTNIKSSEVQVQKSGLEGFSHNEINPSNKQNRLIQIWFKPLVKEQKASYIHYEKNKNKISHIYGNKELKSSTIMDIIKLNKNETFSYIGEYQAYMIKGSICTKNHTLVDGDFFQSSDINVVANEYSEFIYIY